MTFISKSLIENEVADLKISSAVTPTVAFSKSIQLSFSYNLKCNAFEKSVSLKSVVS